MKKKVLSALLAVALFAGLAVPAFADFPISPESGDEEKITSLAFSESSYTVADGSSINLAEKLTAYVGDSKIAQYPTIEWSISENDALTIDDNGSVAAIYSKGSATVTAKADNGKKVTVKVTAKAAASTKYATGWKFANTKNTLISSVTAPTAVTAAAQYIEIEPTPAGTEFSPQQIATIKTAIGNQNGEKGMAVEVSNTDLTSIASADVTNSTVDPDTKNLKIKYTVTDDKSTTRDDTISLKVKLNKGESNTDFYAESTKTTRVAVVKAIASNKIVKTGSITVEIGKTIDLNKYVAYGPSGANTGKGISSALVGPYSDKSESVDYAVIDDTDCTKLLGVAVGQCKVTVTALDGTETTINVNVVKRGSTSLTEPTLSATTASLEVGGTAYIAVKNPNADADYEWTIDNENCTIVPGVDGEAVKIFAKKVGTSKVICYAGNVEIGTIEVTVKAATTTTPSNPGATNNPQTGDSIFAGLF